MAYRERKIHWSNEEVRLVAQKTLEMQKKAPNVPLLELVRLAQRALPEHRQRPLKGWKHVNRVEEQMMLLVAIPEAALPTSTRPTPPPKSAKHIDSPPGLLSVTDTFAQELSKVLVRMAMQELIPQLSAQVEQAVERALARAQRVSVATSPIPPTGTGTALVEQKPEAIAPKKPLKRVLIIGLMPDQQEHIRREYSTELDLRFLKGQDGMVTHQVQENARHADYTIGMNKFIKHSDEYAAKQVARAYISLYGGVSGLRDVLDDIALGQDPRAKQAENRQR